MAIERGGEVDLGGHWPTPYLRCGCPGRRRPQHPGRRCRRARYATARGFVGDAALSVSPLLVPESYIEIIKKKTKLWPRIIIVLGNLVGKFQFDLYNPLLHYFK
jgi:hypothetical protein